MLFLCKVTVQGQRDRWGSAGPDNSGAFSLKAGGRGRSVRGGRCPHGSVGEAGEVTVHEGGQRGDRDLAGCIQ